MHQQRVTTVFLLILLAFVLYAITATYYRSFVSRDFEVIQEEELLGEDAAMDME